MGMIINVRKSYFNYLLSLVEDSNHNPKEYTKLLTLLNETPFVVMNPMDDNRALDAEKLRDDWLDHAKIKDDRLRQEYAKDLGTIEPSMLGVSMLEMLIGLSTHVVDFILADPDKPELVGNLFWDLIDNVVEYGAFGTKYKRANDILTDAQWCDFASETMKSCLNRINTRTYHPDGTGGLFPLKNPKINERKEEIWTCCMAYISENYY